MTREKYKTEIETLADLCITARTNPTQTVKARIKRDWQRLSKTPFPYRLKKTDKEYARLVLDAAVSLIYRLQ